MTQPELEIVWDGGSLDLLGENDTPYGPVHIEAVGEGTEWGNPESVRRTLLSALSNGSVVMNERHDNRTVVVKLRLTAGDSAALAGGEAPLHMLSTKRRAELRWTPPNAFAAPAAFIVVASDLTFDQGGDWDLDENACRREYTLTLTCLPFACSIDPVVIKATPAFVGAPAILNDCSTTAGWSGTGGMTFTVAGGASVGVWLPAGGGVQYATLTQTFVRSKRYLAIQSIAAMGTLVEGHPVTVSGPGGTFALWPVGSDAGWLFFDHPGNVTSITVAVENGGGTTFPVGLIHSIGEADAPSVSAGRQALQILRAPGSAPGDCSLAISSRNASDDGKAGTVLGQVIAYSGPAYDPRLSTGRTESVVLDSNALSGASVTKTDASFVFVRPATAFAAGSHGIWVHAKGTNGQAVTWTLTVRAIGSQSTYTSVAHTLAVVGSLTASTVFTSGGYHLLNLGAIHLPGFDVVDLSQVNLRFELAVNGTVTLDEALAFNRTLGLLTVADARSIRSMRESSTPGVWDSTLGATRVWLDAPTLASGSRVMAGRMTREHAMPVALDSALQSWDGAHLLSPPVTHIYVATTLADDPVVTGIARPAWHTHPAR